MMFWRSLATYIAIVIFILLVGYAGWYYYSPNTVSDTREGPISGYSDELRKERIDTKVTIGGQVYRVQNGVVETPAQSGVATEEILRLAYARTLSERHPVFNLSGVDPDALTQSVEKLKTTQASLAKSPRNISDAELIDALYPVRFLEALSTLEAARQKFIASGSDIDGQQYEEELKKASAAGLGNIGEFNRGMEKIIVERIRNFSSFTVSGFGSTISTSTLLSVSKRLATRMQEAAESVGRYLACVHGNIAKCTSGNISLPQLDKIPPLTSKKYSWLVSEIELVIKQVVFKDRPTRVFVLASSACMAALLPPYYFLADPTIDQDRRFSFQYIGDLFFQPIRKDTQTFLTSFAETYDASYSFVNPNLFYMCPNVGEDLARIKALAATAAFAKAHPEVAASRRAPLVSENPLSEGDAVSYLATALDEQRSRPDENLPEVVRLALMYRDRSAGLETVVSQIAFINGHHAALDAKDISFDVSTRQLYLTGSAMLTLFLSHNPSAGSSTISLRTRTPGNLSILLGNYKAYSTLRVTVPQEKLIHDMKATSNFEGH